MVLLSARESRALSHAIVQLVVSRVVIVVGMIIIISIFAIVPLARLENMGFRQIHVQLVLNILRLLLPVIHSRTASA